jgi:hypothetical protein
LGVLGCQIVALDPSEPVRDLGAVVVRRLLGALVVVVLAGFVFSSASARPPRLLGPGERWLPVGDWTERFCAGGDLPGDVRLHGSPDEPRGAWMTFEDGSRKELVWTAGTSARFTPALEVIGPYGNVITSEGSRITSGCPVGDASVLFVGFQSPSP